MGRYFGIAAVDLIVKEDFGKMVSFRNGRITAVPLQEAVGRLNLVDVQTQYDPERYNGQVEQFWDLKSIKVTNWFKVPKCLKSD
jgi:6-phosphofructokinase